MQVRVNDAKTWIRDAEASWELNEPDAYALEEALQLREKHGGEVVVISVGPARVTQVLREALARIPGLREEFWNDVSVPGSGAELNQSLEKAGRVADFLELGELMCRDALEREESCGGHFRTEYQDEGEARRDDSRFCHVAAWEWTGENNAPRRHVEPLTFENVTLTTRSYK